MTVGNFTELISTNGSDSIKGLDLEVVYVLNATPILEKLPEEILTTISVDGSDSNSYQICKLLDLENWNLRRFLWTNR